MLFHFVLCARPSHKDPALEKHPFVLRALMNLELEWRVSGSKIGKLVKDSPTAFCNLSHAFLNGTKGRIVYSYKPIFGYDDARSDHTFILEFKSDKVNLSQFIDNVIPGLIEAFVPYIGELTDDKVYTLGPVIDRRNQVGRIGIVSFIDKELCLRAFGLTPTAVCRHLKEYVE